jgi:hypothetical protein
MRLIAAVSLRLSFLAFMIVSFEDALPAAGHARLLIFVLDCSRFERPCLSETCHSRVGMCATRCRKTPTSDVVRD